MLIDMIKPLLVDEVTSELLAPMFEEVAAAVPSEHLPDKLNLPHIVLTWTALMRQGLAETWAGYADGKAVGVLGGLFMPDFYTAGMIAMEMFWFVLKANRKGALAMRLFKAFESEAIRRGATTIWAGSNRFHEPERMAKLYSRLGFEAWGWTFRKVV